MRTNSYGNIVPDEDALIYDYLPEIFSGGVSFNYGKDYDLAWNFYKALELLDVPYFDERDDWEMRESIKKFSSFRIHNGTASLTLSRGDPERFTSVSIGRLYLILQEISESEHAEHYYFFG